jgi:hypothetical protein
MMANNFHSPTVANNVGFGAVDNVSDGLLEAHKTSEFDSYSLLTFQSDTFQLSARFS